MKNSFLTILFNLLFDLSLRKNPLSWIAIFIMKSRKCAPAARWLQYKKGGKIVYTVKHDWSDGKISDHFMNLINSEIIDLNGNHARLVNGQTVDFGDGQYRIVQIADNWSEFKINGLVDLKNKDRYIHSLILKENHSL